MSGINDLQERKDWLTQWRADLAPRNDAESAHQRYALMLEIMQIDLAIYKEHLRLGIEKQTKQGLLSREVGDWCARHAFVVFNGDEMS